MEAVKKEAELAGMRRAHLVDGMDMAKFMAWLEHTADQNLRVSEVDVYLRLMG